jgi:hypothetical protein
MFPGCGFKTHQRNLMDYHHIVPKSLGGEDAPRNRIWLCAGCHRKIHVPEVSSGIHLAIGLESIVILQKLKTSAGEALRYVSCRDGLQRVYYYRDGTSIVLDEKRDPFLFDKETQYCFKEELKKRGLIL